MILLSYLKARFRALNRVMWGALIALPTTSHAATIESILNNSISLLTGPFARLVGIVILIGSGYMCLVQQKFSKERFVVIVAGLAIIFGAAFLYDAFLRW